MNVMKQWMKKEISIKLQDFNREFLGCSLKILSIKKEKKMDRLEIDNEFHRYALLF